MADDEVVPPIIRTSTDGTMCVLSDPFMSWGPKEQAVLDSMAAWKRDEPARRARRQAEIEEFERLTGEKFHG